MRCTLRRVIELWQWPLLFGTGLVAGFVDSIAGGGGLIALPVLLGFGFEPKYALGTNKLQATFGSASASWHYARAKVVDLRDCPRGFVFSFVGAALGTVFVLRLDPIFLRRCIPVLLLAIALYTLFKPELGDKDIHPRMTPERFAIVFGLLIGFYDGFLGPGAGTFWTMAFMLSLGFNMTKATGHAKVMNFASNLASLLFFLQAGQILFFAGLAMGVGQLLGARLGSRMVVTKGTRFIRPIFISVVVAITLKLLYDSYLKQLNLPVPAQP